ncbi:hypothetical protein WJX84_008288 [Apatococcus fuscideae]|uniref:PPIase cyclophilin-type domain-containing protein n=1 Tax=Apatococcus fuscideae TaxID=2026836 RepID=A0AAW1SW98_9CHLO
MMVLYSQATARPLLVFMDFAVNSNPQGRIEIELFSDVPVGSRRFHQLAIGDRGVGYRLSKIDGVSKDFVKSSGVSRLSYKEGDETSIAGGDALGQLEAEMELSKHPHTESGLVSILVKDLTPKKTKQRLVAYQGKLISVEENLGGANPNGTSFAITLRPAPELDPSTWWWEGWSLGWTWSSSWQPCPLSRQTKTLPTSRQQRPLATNEQMWLNWALDGPLARSS